MSGNDCDEDGESVRRRDMLAGLTGLGSVGILGSALPANATSPTGSWLELVLLNGSGAEPLTPGRLANMLSRAQEAFGACQYQRLASLLPKLIGSAQTSRSELTGKSSASASSILARAYQLTSELCIKLNEDGAAWVLADRAMTTARVGGDAGTIAKATQWVAISMRRHGHHAAATALLTKTASDMGASTGDRDPRVLASYGSLLCTAAYASAQGGRRTESMDLIDEACEAARRLGDTRVTGSIFGSANVTVYRIGIHNALGESGLALTQASLVKPDSLPTAERYARYCVDTARAWELHGNTERAYQALRAAEHHAPEEITRPSVQNLISALLYAPGNTPSGLRDLADRAGAA